MQRIAPRAPVERAAGGLAVDGAHLIDAHGECCDEAAETGLEPGRIEQPEQTRERVVAGNAARQGEEAAQERLLRPAERRHVDTALRTGQHRGQSDQQTLQQIMPLRIARPWIGKPRKTGTKPLHPRPPETSREGLSTSRQQKILQTSNAIPLGYYLCVLVS